MGAAGGGGDGWRACLSAGLVCEDERISARQSGETDYAYHCQMGLMILKDLRLGIAVLPSDRDTKASLPAQRFDRKGFCRTLEGAATSFPV